MFYSGKAVIYIRLSTKKECQDERLGIAAQRRVCRDYCIRNNILIIETYEEIVSACVSFNKRLVFPRVIGECIKANALLVVATQDRLTRNLDDWSGFNNGRIYGKLTPKLICADNPSQGTLEGDIRAVFAQHERNIISKRTRNALREKKSQGANLGAIGRKVSLEKARAATQDAIALALHLRDEGLAYEDIADELNHQGYVTSRGTPWSRELVMYRIKSYYASQKNNSRIFI